MMPEVKDYAIRCLRTFIAAAIATLPTFNLANIDSASLKAIGVSAVIAGVNAVVLTLQRATPGVPNP